MTLLSRAPQRRGRSRQSPCPALPSLRVWAGSLAQMPPPAFSASEECLPFRASRDSSPSGQGWGKCDFTPSWTSFPQNWGGSGAQSPQGTLILRVQSDSQISAPSLNVAPQALTDPSLADGNFFPSCLCGSSSMASSRDHCWRVDGKTSENYAFNKEMGTMLSLHP